MNYKRVLSLFSLCVVTVPLFFRRGAVGLRHSGLNVRQILAGIKIFFEITKIKLNKYDGFSPLIE